MKGRWLVGALVLGVVAAFAAGWWASTWSAGVAPPPVQMPARLTAPVSKGTLDDALLTEASLDYPVSGSVRTNGGTVTALRAVGATLREGDSAIEVSLKPVFVLMGNRPMFRTLSLKAHGADVRQLNRALARLRLGADPKSSRFTTRTWAAWSRFLKARHRGAPKQRSISTAAIAFVPTLPARVAANKHAVGESADGVAVELAATTPRVQVTVPASSVPTLPATPAISLISPDDQSLIPLRIVGSARTDDGGLRFTVTGKVNRAWLGKPLRARVGGASDGRTGLIVPTAALTLAGDGTATVIRARDSAQLSVRVLATDRSNAMVEGALQVGDDVVLGP